MSDNLEDAGSVRRVVRIRNRITALRKTSVRLESVGLENPRIRLGHGSTLKTQSHRHRYVCV